MDRFLGVDLTTASVVTLERVLKQGRAALRNETVLVDEKLRSYVTLGICSTLAWRELARQRDQTP